MSVDNGDWLNVYAMNFFISLTFLMAFVLLLESLVTIAVNVRNQALRDMNCAQVIISMAVCSIGIALFISTWMIVKMTTSGKYSWWRCVTFKITVRMLHTVTVFNLCCLSLDRYLFICWPLHYHQLLTPRRCNLLVAACWLAAASLLGLPTLLRLDFCPRRGNKYMVSEVFMITYISAYGVSAAVVVILYLLVAREVSVALVGARADLERARRKTRQSIFTVVFIQLVLSAPDMVIQLMSLSDSDYTIRAANLSPILLLFAQLLFLPVYAWKNTYYRAAIVDLFSRAFHFVSATVRKPSNSRSIAKTSTENSREPVIGNNQDVTSRVHSVDVCLRCLDCGDGFSYLGGSVCAA
ncbi:olfactory receptor 4K2-like isoform X2 [Penaeus japonicus]|uniref:olfactory receptor 4K2-like isoform X2 n=1 Tax=Penaeus japonicus TaxID=27405 RepID=UPI001C70D284|nr:olfactory receptor 4K2-like isoform X2 [Penaeus japonicus]